MTKVTYMDRKERRAKRAASHNMAKATAFYAANPDMVGKLTPANHVPAEPTRPYMWREMRGEEVYGPVPDSLRIASHKPSRENPGWAYRGRGRGGYKWRDADGKTAPVRVPWTKADVTR